MANSLLDFVMALVRDPDAAARYAADPSQALADAHLTDVTSADVQNLIPVVAESLSMSVPAHGLDALAAEPVGNVWASGAATAAFDAFDDQLPVSAVVDPASVSPAIVDDLGVEFDLPSGIDNVEPAVSLQLVDPVVVEDLPTPDAGLGGDWVHPGADPDPGDVSSVFDLFD